LEQIRHVIHKMPANTDIEQRNRALIAFTILTGARDGAIACFKLRHVDITESKIDQDARQVRTKFSKPFVTTFFPVGDDIRAVVVNGFNICVAINYGGWTIRCFRRPWSQWGTISGLKQRGSIASTGATQGLFVQYLGMPSRQSAFPISTRIAFVRHLHCSAENSARPPRSTRPGRKTWDTTRVDDIYQLRGRW
jgi:hypothetical protein